MNRYVKIEGHSEWFLFLECGQKEPEGMSENMQQRILRSQVNKLHHDTPKNRMEFKPRLVKSATMNIDYEQLAVRHNGVLIRQIGSYMPIYRNKITHELYDKDFPISEYAEIVICENDETPEWCWKKYIEKRFPDTKYLTINFFDLRSEYDVQRYFEHAKYVTFYTTFSDLEWFKKLTRNLSGQKVIGHSCVADRWEEALQINSDVEIISEL